MEVWPLVGLGRDLPWHFRSIIQSSCHCRAKESCSHCWRPEGWEVSWPAVNRLFLPDRYWNNGCEGPQIFGTTEGGGAQNHVWDGWGQVDRIPPAETVRCGPEGKLCLSFWGHANLTISFFFYSYIISSNFYITHHIFHVEFHTHTQKKEFALHSFFSCSQLAVTILPVFAWWTAAPMIFTGTNCFWGFFCKFCSPFFFTWIWVAECWCEIQQARKE